MNTNSFHFDPLDPEFLADPWPVFRRARTDHPIYVHESCYFQPVSLFRYRDVSAAVVDYGSFSSYMGEEIRERAMADLNIMVGDDPPEHDRLRKILNSSFSPALIRKLENDVENYCTEVIEQVLDVEEFNMVEDVAAKITIFMIAQMLGLPKSAQPLFRRWTKELMAIDGQVHFMKDEGKDLLDITERVMCEMDEYFREEIQRKKGKASEDLITLMHNSGLSFSEIKGLSKNMVVAGNETTTNLINNTVRLLIDHRDQEMALRTNPDMVVQAIEEILRYFGSVHFVFRRAAKDIELYGVQIKKDQIVVPWLISANRDESAFERAEEFDVTRKPVRHIAFGRGIHTCIGNILARLEGRIALETILKRTRSMQRTREKMAPGTGPVMNGVQDQWVHFESA